jgi:hypothetical protein
MPRMLNHRRFHPWLFGSLIAKGLNFEPGVVYECRADALSITDWTEK